MEENNNQHEGKVWISHKWMTPRQVEEHMKAVGEMVSDCYQRMAAKAEYNTRRTRN